MLVELYAAETIQTAVGLFPRGTVFRAEEKLAISLLKTGRAILHEEHMRTPWQGLVWPNSEVAILASGPSMTPKIADLVADWKSKAGNRKVIAINTTFKLAPWADVLFACDLPWWNHYIEEVRKTFK